MERIKQFHLRELLHRDIKPDNYGMGLNEKHNVVYIFDYGLAKRYIHSITREHIQFSDKKRMVGTSRYCSLNSQMGCEQGRRDDLESLGYCVIYMLKGRLPWQGIKGATKDDKNRKVLALKSKISIGDLCKGLPNEVAQYMYYCRNLRFEEKPAYSQLHSLLYKVFKKNTCLQTFQYDWHIMKCDIIKTAKNSEDSNNADYEGANNPFKTRLSRKVEIQNLVSRNIPEKVIPKNKIIEEEKKVEKSEALTINNVKLLIGNKKSKEEKNDDIITNKTKRSESQRKLIAIHTKEVELYLNEAPVVSESKKLSNNELLCDFIPAEITERKSCNGISLYINRQHYSFRENL